MNDRFERIGELGRGGSAIVWLAWDRVRQERVALKVLHPHLVDTPAAVARLRRELEAGKRIHHPGALLPYELHDEGGQLALSMPLHEGETLAEHVAAHGPWGPDALFGLLRRLAEVLHAAHLAGVLHRDVSPHNVMVDRVGEVVLTDFGLARLAGGRTVTAIAGTPGYAAPETWLGGGPADPRADLYSAAAVVVFAATGAPPALTPRADRPELSTLPPALRPLLERLLAADPEARPRGAREVLDALLRPDPVATPSPHLPTVTAELPPGPWRVVVWESSSLHGRRARLRSALRWSRRESDHWTRRLLPAAAERVWGALHRTSRDAEQRIANGVGWLAGIPPGALAVPDALTTRQFRLVEGVQQTTAELVAQLARNEGFHARALPTEGDVAPGARWAAAGVVSLLWLVLLATAGPIGVEDTPLFIVSALLHGLWWIASIALGVRAFIAARQRHLPLVYTADLRPFLRPGTVQVVGARPEAAAEAHSPDPLVARALDRIEAARAQLRAHRSLPQIIHDDADRTLTDLRRAALALAAHLDTLDPTNLADLEARLDQAEARARRSRLLAAAPDADGDVQAADRRVADLTRARDRAEWSEGQRVEAHARLLEISSLAADLLHELAAPGAIPRSIDAALSRAAVVRQALSMGRANAGRPAS